MMNDPRIGNPGALPQATISGAPFAFPNVTLVKLGGGYRAALDPFVHPAQDAILSELRAMVAAELAPVAEPVTSSRKRKVTEPELPPLVQDEQVTEQE